MASLPPSQSTIMTSLRSYLFLIKYNFFYALILWSDFFHKRSNYRWKKDETERVWVTDEKSSSSPLVKIGLFDA